jgi:hypothetical protein
MKIKRTQPKKAKEPTIEDLKQENLSMALAVAEAYEKMMELDMKNNLALAELAELTLGGN